MTKTIFPWKAWLLVVATTFSSTGLNQLSGDERPLTPEEKEAIEYVITNAFGNFEEYSFFPNHSEQPAPPSLFVDESEEEESGQTIMIIDLDDGGMAEPELEALKEALDQIILVDKSSWSWESWTGYPAMLSGMGGVTIGETQVYPKLPPPNSLALLPILTHEAVHTYQQELALDSFPIFMVDYTWGLVLDGYRYSEMEMEAYAIEYTVKELLKDPAFISAVLNGTTENLPKEYGKKIETIFNQKYLEELNNKARVK